MLHGGCLCGGVRYKISGELSKMHFCHCQMCRRIHGTPFANYVAVNPRDIRYTQGEELISSYQSSESTARTPIGVSIFLSACLLYLNNRIRYS